MAAVFKDELVCLSKKEDAFKMGLSNLATPVQVNVGNHSWGNYFLAAYKGVFDYLAERGLQLPSATGLQVRFAARWLALVSFSSLHSLPSTLDLLVVASSG